MHRLFITVLLILLTASAIPVAAMPYDARDIEDEPITSMVMGRKGDLIVATRDGTISALKINGERIVLAIGLGATRCLAVSPCGDIFVALAADGRIIRLDMTGRVNTVAHGLGEIQGLAVDRDGNLLVAHGPRGSLTRLECPRQTPTP